MRIVLLSVLFSIAFAIPALGNIYGKTEQRVKANPHDNIVMSIGLVYRKSESVGNIACTGTLVSEKLVLTAAHCLKMKDGHLDQNFPARFIPNLFGNKMRRGSQPIKVLDAVTGGFIDGLNMSRNSDWALLKLEEVPTYDNGTPFPIQKIHLGPVHKNTRISSIGYSRDLEKGQTPYRHDHCKIRVVYLDNSLAHDCSTTQFNSGGALFMISESESGGSESVVMGITNAEIRNKAVEGTAQDHFVNYDEKYPNLGATAKRFYPTWKQLREEGW